MGKFIHVILAILLVLTLAGGSAAAADLLLILDASGSMWGQVGGENKIVIARRTLENLAPKIPADSRLGLIAYGHRREGDCTDIETIARLGSVDAAGLVAKVNAINPKGKTPITAAIDAAVEAVRAGGEPATIVLLSDGLETCGGDPCRAVTIAKKSGADFLLHVIGFDLDEENVEQLECAAQAGGGLYFDAGNAGELADALRRTVAEAPEEVVPGSVLSVKVQRNGQPFDALVEVFAADGSRVAAGRTYTGEATNPRRLPLAAGKYNVRVAAVGLHGEIRQGFEIDVPDGDTVVRTVDFSSGAIAVKVSRNGALSDATVKVFSAAGGPSVARGRTYRAASSNPRMMELTAGLYNVEIASVEIIGKPTHRFENVRLEPGKRVDLEHEFRSGDLKVGCRYQGRLVDCVLNIVSAATRKAVAGGRTYVDPKTNPKSFLLPPGVYTVTARPVRTAGAQRRTFEIEVPDAGAAERMIDLGG